MNAKHLPFPGSGHNDPANSEDAAPDPHGFIANLQRIGAGCGSDGLPWPEPNLPIGRRIQLADGDCALAGLRIVHEVMLAAERSRQHGGPEHDVGPRVMEGLMMACLELGTHAAERVRPR
ncbi:MAG TPA: hypothetical protein DIV57_03505 [Stenotrophomonas sp.]|uniref:hypothetical protein n=1 Tax=Stenotrophomonas sp. SPM TaxID=2170735 RepID=UPI000DE6663A|nr:hypothetical protein [Stenotrophomonas sp. SPM]PWB24897.1 hypothetical protein DCO49_11410 [Stenotrophomonas sp. SPM]HCR32422.1 hypothetical protein [Stenotrophomonas sp.]